METNLMTFKAAIAAFFTALGAFLGWQGVMIVVWVICMILDYISGSCAAAKNGEWCSSTAREGIWHKGGMIVVVIVAAVADLVMGIICEHLPVDMTWPVLILPMVLAWYILTEVGSILENAIKMGAAVPSWIVKLLKVGMSVVDKVADAVNITEKLTASTEERAVEPDANPESDKE